MAIDLYSLSIPYFSCGMIKTGYTILLNFQPRILRFSRSDWLTHSRLSAHIPYGKCCQAEKFVQEVKLRKF